MEKHTIELPEDFPTSVSLANLKKKETSAHSKLPCPSQQIRIKEPAFNPPTSAPQS